MKDIIYIYSKTHKLVSAITLITVFFYLIRVQADQCKKKKENTHRVWVKFRFEVNIIYLMVIYIYNTKYNGPWWAFHNNREREINVKQLW